MNKKIVPCQLCGLDATLKYFDYPGYQKPQVFSIYDCHSCNTSFVFPKVNVEELYEKIYNLGSKVPGYNRYWKYLKEVKRSSNPLGYLSTVENIYWSINEALVNIKKERADLKVLEIGSGLGYLTYSLNVAGYNTLGLDISSTAVMQAVSNFGEFYVCGDLFEYSEQFEGSYDVVIMSEVIEHVQHPVDFVEALLRLLKPEGRAIITTPNKSIYPSNVIWKTENPPIHFWWFSEDSLRFILKKKNVKIEFIDFTKFHAKYSYTKIRFEDFTKQETLPSILDENGSLLLSVDENSSFYFSLRRYFSGFQFVQRVRILFLRLLDSFNAKVYVCKDKSTILCCVVHKQG